MGEGLFFLPFIIYLCKKNIYEGVIFDNIVIFINKKI